MYYFISPLLKKRLQVVQDRCHYILNSEKFEQLMLNHKSFFNTMDTGYNVWEKLLSSTQICNMNELGIRRFSPIYRNVVAELNNNIVYFNPKFLNRDDASHANTLVHEYLHFIGYSHIHNNPRRYPQILNSVNYVVGDIMEKLYKEFYAV